MHGHATNLARAEEISVEFRTVALITTGAVEFVLHKRLAHVVIDPDAVARPVIGNRGIIAIASAAHVITRDALPGQRMTDVPFDDPMIQRIVLASIGGQQAEGALVIGHRPVPPAIGCPGIGQIWHRAGTDVEVWTQRRIVLTGRHLRSIAGMEHLDGGRENSGIPGRGE